MAWHSMRLALAAGALALLAGCGQKEGAIQVVVHFEGLVPGCLALVATSSGKADTVEVGRAELAQPARAVIAIGKDSAWSDTVDLTLRVFERDCASTALATQAFTVTLKKGEVTTWETTVTIPDADGDGYAPTSANGTDCDDGNPARHPGATEVCSGTVDLDCNGAFGCADSVCNNQSCDDSNACTRNDACASGRCQGSAVTCASPPGECFAAMGTCQPSDGGCDYAPRTGAACTLPDGGADGGCRSDGTCAFGEVNCADGLDNDNDGLTDCADPDCLRQACDDRNACTDGDRCDTTGPAGCVGTARQCTTPTGECFTDAGACVAQNDAGSCVYPPAPSSTPCDAGDRCTSNDRCNGAGACAAGPVTVTCTTPPPDQGCYQPGACQPATGTCLYLPRGAGYACADQNACTFTDVCNGDGGCKGTDYSCVAGDCQTGAACLGDGGCSFTVAAPGTACGGGTGSCIAGGTCLHRGTPFGYTPDNFNPADYVATGGALTIGCAAVLTTDGGFAPGCTPTGTPTFDAVVMSGGTEAMVMAVQGLHVTGAGSLTVVGGRPLIIAVYGDAILDGPVFANSQRAGFQRWGPGARSAADCGGQAGGAGQVNSNKGGGGGGAGFLTDGGLGGEGNNNATTPGRPGAAIAGGDVPLLAGCPGGNGGNGVTPGASLGGAGGGAIQLSVSGLLRVSNTVSASGQGGTGGARNDADPGGGGGGSGGVVLLQADRVVVETGAKLTCNGGAGAGGADNNNGTNGGVGNDGPTGTANPAPGGPAGANGAGAGGDGAAGSTLPGNGLPGSKGGGGAGGAMGRVFVKAVDAGCVYTPSIESPAATRTNCP